MDQVWTPSAQDPSSQKYRFDLDPRGGGPVPSRRLLLGIAILLILGLPWLITWESGRSKPHVPDFTGLTLTEATGLIESHRMCLNEVKWQAGNGGQTGVVIAQSPSPGYPISESDSRTPITLILGGSPQPPLSGDRGRCGLPSAL